MKKEDLDIPLSQNVAEKASTEINKLKQKLQKDKDLQISLLQDALMDNKQHNNFYKKLAYVLCAVVFFVLVCTCAIAIHGQYMIARTAESNIAKMMEYISGGETESEIYINTENNSENEGSINITR